MLIRINEVLAVDPASMQAELEAQARGYELVLEREPENQTAS